MTVGRLIDRLYRQVLEPPSAQPALTTVVGSLNIGATQFTRGSFELPEDENLLRLGSLLEADQELMRVTDYVSATGLVDVDRGVLGTEEADHVAGSPLKLSPPYPRIDAFNAVRDNITSLYPRLWTVRAEVVSAVQGGNVFVVEDNLVVELIEANPDQWTGTPINYSGRIVDYHQSVDGRALILNQAAPGQVWVRWRRRFGVAEAETDTMDELGVDSVWEFVVLIGAAADMTVGRDIPEINTEWVQSALEAENIRVGQRLSLSAGLAQYRDLLIDRFSKEMSAEDAQNVQVQFTDPFAQAVR